MELCEDGTLCKIYNIAVIWVDFANFIKQGVLAGEQTLWLGEKFKLFDWMWDKHVARWIIFPKCNSRSAVYVLEQAGPVLRVGDYTTNRP